MTSRNTTAVRTAADGGTTGNGTPDPDPLHSPPGDPAGNGAAAALGHDAVPDPTTQENEESAGHEPGIWCSWPASKAKFYKNLLPLMMSRWEN